MERILRTFEHPDGKRRVLIVQRENGTFGYEQEKLVYRYEDEEMREKWPEMSWTRPGQYEYLRNRRDSRARSAWQGCLARFDVAQRELKACKT